MSISLSAQMHRCNAHMSNVLFVKCSKRGFYLLTGLDRFALMVLRGNKIAEPKREERCNGVPPPPHSLLSLCRWWKWRIPGEGRKEVKAQVWRLQTAAEPVFLCYLVQSGLEIKEAGESPENQATLLDYRGTCQERQYFTQVITQCAHERVM